MVSMRQRGLRLPKKPQARRQNRRDSDELGSTYQQSYWVVHTDKLGAGHQTRAKDIARRLDQAGKVIIDKGAVSEWKALCMDLAAVVVQPPYKNMAGLSEVLDRIVAHHLAESEAAEVAQS
jgi:hypothetical protein